MKGDVCWKIQKEDEEERRRKHVKKRRIKDLSRVDARESDDACRFLRNFSA